MQQKQVTATKANCYGFSAKVAINLWLQSNDINYLTDWHLDMNVVRMQLAEVLK